MLHKGTSVVTVRTSGPSIKKGRGWRLVGE